MEETVEKTAPKEKKTVETVEQFEQKIAEAQREGTEWIETTPEMIAKYNRTGLGGNQYFIYKGVKVAPYGEIEAIVDREDEQLGQRIHGRSEGVVING